MREKLCVVMPVYNEREAVGAVLEKWDAMLKGLGIDYEIRPYNDGSKDDSLEVMRKVAGRLGPRINVRDKPNGGHGNTILTGYREAASDGFDWVFQIDSDDEMGPEKFGDLWSQRVNYDFLVGIREGRIQAWPRKIISFISRLCVRLFYGKSVWDVNTPYRLMRVSSFKGFYNKIPLDTFAPNVILSGLAARYKLRSYEIHVPQHDRTTGEVSIKKWKLLKAAVKSFWQTIEFSLDSCRGWFVFGCLALISTALKVNASLKGWNFDFESYNVVADIVNAGKNVYAETSRYNYGPIWFLILGLLKALCGTYFRWALILFLSLADVGIAVLLWRKRMILPTIVFLLSAVSIKITGFCNQFDNLAILIAFVALTMMDDALKMVQGNDRKYYCGVALLGVSIILKHIFVFMPFWWLFRKAAWKKRIVGCFMPIVMFVMSFVPYSGITDLEHNKQVVSVISRLSEYTKGATSQREGLKKYYREVVEPMKHPATGILANVVMYRSAPTADFYRCFLPNIVYKNVPPILLFVLMMIGLGFVSRNRGWFECGLIYTLGMFVFTPSMAIQYFAIPCAAAAVFWKPFGIVFHLIAGAACYFSFGGGALMISTIRLVSITAVIGCLSVALHKDFLIMIRNVMQWLVLKFHISLPPTSVLE